MKKTATKEPSTFQNRYMSKPVRPTRVAAKKRYPYIYEMDDVNFFGEFVGETSSGKATVRLTPYKGALLLEIDEDGACSNGPSSIWLRGDDLDALVKLFRRGKASWLKSYRHAERAKKRKKK